MAAVGQSKWCADGPPRQLLPDGWARGSNMCDGFEHGPTHIFRVVAEGPYFIRLTIYCRLKTCMFFWDLVILIDVKSKIASYMFQIYAFDYNIIG